ncbi:S-Ena type endospore appendage [Paenibacillus hodogayensis]|uniref:S-Ena type endospore appendage n=1 Tax=Paenibacillus hodogayensis TaxID=279208 RepID=A0ABV5VZ12_9BACL
MCDQVTGRIFQTADGGPKTYFTTSVDYASAIVRVDNDTATPMSVTIGLRDGQMAGGLVEQGQQVSFDVPGIRTLSVGGTGGNGICKGFYHIRLRTNIAE